MFATTSSDMSDTSTTFMAMLVDGESTRMTLPMSITPSPPTTATPSPTTTSSLPSPTTTTTTTATTTATATATTTTSPSPPPYTVAPPPTEDPTNYLPLAAPVDAESVQSLLAHGETVIYDVRSDEAYQKEHIDGALSLALPNILFRRFLKTRLTPGSLDRVAVTEAFQQALAPLASLSPQALVLVYDESTSHVEDMPASWPLRTFVEYFAMLSFNVCYVEGGLRAVRQAHPSLVVAGSVAMPGRVFVGIPISETALALAAAKSQALAQQALMTPEEVRQLRAHPREELHFMHGFLAVGSEAQGQDLDLLLAEGVTHVLNVTNTPFDEAVSARLHTLQISLNDTLSENLLAHLFTALRFIDAARLNGGKVLVHCFAGISRSVSICVAYIMWAQGLSMTDAMEFVKAHRKCASPNLNFVGQLILFERTMRGSPTTSPTNLRSTESLTEVCTIAIESLHNAMVVAN